MLRLIGFFVAVLFAMRLLQALPGVGHLFHGLLGFWLVAIGVSAALARLSAWMLEERRLAARIEELGRVDNPHQRGKLGALYVAHGRYRKALEPLREALEGDPDALEWRYRLGCALLGSGEAAGAAEELLRVTEKDEEYAYGAAQLRLAEALTRAGDPERALAALDRFDRNHGESPESAFRRGQALRRAGRRAEARAAFARVPELAHSSARFQEKHSGGWVWRSAWARFLP